MAFRSGLGAQLTAVLETTVGTYVAPSTAFEFNDESLELEAQWLESQGIKQGVGIGRVSRAAISRKTVKGDITMEAADRKMGRWLKAAAGTNGVQPTPTQIATSGAYQTRFDPFDRVGVGMTIQVGRPVTTSTNVAAYSYSGCKIPSFEFSCSDNQIAQWKFAIDGMRETTAQTLVSPVYTTGTAPFRFSECNQIQIGTAGATYTSGIASVASPTSPTDVIKGISVKWDTPMATERFGLGSAGIKAEAYENGIQSCMIELDTENTDTIAWNNYFDNQSTITFGFRFQHGDAGGGNPFELGMVFPACKVKSAPPMVSGPDLVNRKVTLQAYDPEVSGQYAWQIRTVDNQSTL